MRSFYVDGGDETIEAVKEQFPLCKFKQLPGTKNTEILRITIPEEYLADELKIRIVAYTRANVFLIKSRNLKNFQENYYQYNLDHFDKDPNHMLYGENAITQRCLREYFQDILKYSPFLYKKGLINWFWNEGKNEWEWLFNWDKLY